MPDLLGLKAREAHYHVCPVCLTCEYVDPCRDEADAGRDLCRVPYMSSESKRTLRAAGVTVHPMLGQLDEDEVTSRPKPPGTPLDGKPSNLSAVFSASGAGLVFKGVQPEPGDDLMSRLRESSYDLSVNLDRYVACAQALSDGQPRPLEAQTLLMPYWEDVRVVLSAEQDGVTGTCFALGIKTYEEWDADINRPLGIEEVFVSESDQGETDLLLAFLKQFNAVLRKTHIHNEKVRARLRPFEDACEGAKEQWDAAREEEERYKAEKPARLSQKKPDHEPFYAWKDRVEALKNAAREAKQEAQNALDAENAAIWKAKLWKRLHIYVYDSLDLDALRSAVERNLFSDLPELRMEIRELVRLFPPESLLPDADTFKTMPGTVVVDVLRHLVALPVPYLYDLSTVSELYQPENRAGEENGYVYRQRYGYVWEHSNQVAFERIHDVWRGQAFETKKGKESPEQVRRGIERAVRDKLRATDSVIRRLRQDHNALRDQDGVGSLLLGKEPFRLYDGFYPADADADDVAMLSVFAQLEAALDELQVKRMHTLPVADRVARFEAISGLRHERDDEGGGAWFTFDPACRETKFSEGSFNLVLTEQDNPRMLIGQVDGKLFGESPGWKRKKHQVTLDALDLTAHPPLLRLTSSDNLAKVRENVDFKRTLVLDSLHADYTTKRVLDLLERMHKQPQDAQQVAEVLRTGTVAGAHPFVGDLAVHEREMRARMVAAGVPEDRLNAGQWAAWRGVTQAPVSLVWGPPGTGKTHTIAHVLIGYALAARREGRPLRVLVTAFTHHAIVTVLKKVAQLRALYGLSAEDLTIAKVGWENDADDELPEDSFVRIEDGDAFVAAGPVARGCECLVVGATVWSVHKGIEKSPEPGWNWFDVVLVDEASQLRLPDALIAVAAAKPDANIILAGDDRQLPPIIRGAYPEDHEPMLSSVFGFVRHRAQEREEDDPGALDRALFQLTTNYRMNEPLTAYPRSVLYDRYDSFQPERRMVLTEAPDDPLMSALLDPERPVVLVRYDAPRSFAARNPLEAELAAWIADVVSRTLVDEDTQLVFETEDLIRNGLAVTAPHRAQNAAIREALRQRGFGQDERPMLLVDTVEKLQGQEREVIVVSYGVADAEYADGEADFLLSSNRFNVASTRARSKLIVICSNAVLDAVPADRQVLLEATMLKEFRSYCRDGKEEYGWKHAELGDVRLTLHWHGFDAPAQ